MTDIRFHDWHWDGSDWVCLKCHAVGVGEQAVRDCPGPYESPLAVTACCWKCGLPLCRELDSYWGKSEGMELQCAKCRPRGV